MRLHPCRVVRDLQGERESVPCVLTVGSFDGVHRGHQQLIRRVVERARALQARSAVLTFDPDPEEVVRPDGGPRYLTGLDERLDCIGALGVDVIHVLSFTPVLRERDPEAFVELLTEGLALLEVWVGPDFRYGRDRAGDVRQLARSGQRRGFRVGVVEPLRDEGGVISASRIREQVKRGEVEEAARLLGRPPTLEGRVGQGAGRGVRLGYPTANLEVHSRRLLPGDGVYAARARLRRGPERPGMASVGVRPTFEPGGERLVEVHLFDFGGTLYGEEMRVSFLAFLRPELRFPDGQSLTAQMREDERRARELLGLAGEEG